MFDSTHSNGFVIMGFEVSEKGVVENVKFSKNFPEAIKAYILKTFKPEPKLLSPAKVNGIASRKRTVWPILYQYGKPDNYNMDITSIIDAFDFKQAFGYEKGIIEAIVMHVCQTGFTVR
jgi:hypothetical protein